MPALTVSNEEIMTMCAILRKLLKKVVWASILLPLTWVG
jgi:hypothetical protein